MTSLCLLASLVCELVLSCCFQDSFSLAFYSLIMCFDLHLFEFILKFFKLPEFVDLPHFPYYLLNLLPSPILFKTRLQTCFLTPPYFSVYFLRIKIFSEKTKAKLSKSGKLTLIKPYNLIYSPYSIFINCPQNVLYSCFFPGPKSSLRSLNCHVSLVFFNLD